MNEYSLAKVQLKKFVMGLAFLTAEAYYYKKT